MSREIKKTSLRVKRKLMLKFIFWIYLVVTAIYQLYLDIVTTSTGGPYPNSDPNWQLFIRWLFSSLIKYIILVYSYFSKFQSTSWYATDNLYHIQNKVPWCPYGIYKYQISDLGMLKQFRST